MRQNEILSLTWKDVDFKNRQIHVCTSKNGEGRYIPINQALLDYLKEASRHSNGPHVFCNPDGKPHTRFGYIRTAFKKAVEEALGRDFHFHDLRHTFASNLVMEGVDLRTVGQLLGHRSGYKMTERYAHLSPQHMLDAVNKLNKFSGEGQEGRSGKVDTKWTPEPFWVVPSVLSKAGFPLNNQSFSSRGRVAELADAQDLKTSSECVP
jgi:integrase